MSFRPPAHLIVDETEHWLINHRIDSKLPGYLMIGSQHEVTDLSKLPCPAQMELGILLSRVQKILTRLFSPCHLYIGRYGHTEGHSIHFHVIPIYKWVAETFLRDDRYRILRKFDTIPSSGNSAGFDGAEMTLYVWREFCENPNSPPIEGLSVEDTIQLVKKELNSTFLQESENGRI